MENLKIMRILFLSYSNDLDINIITTITTVIVIFTAPIISARRLQRQNKMRLKSLLCKKQVNIKNSINE